MRVWIATEKQWVDNMSTRWIAEWYELDPNWKPAFDGDTPDPIDDTICFFEIFGDDEKAAIAFADSKVDADYFGNPNAVLQRAETYHGTTAAWETIETIPGTPKSEQEEHKA